MLLSLEPRGQQSRLMLWCSPLLAAVLTLGCGSLLFIALGHDPLLTLHTLLIAPVSDLYGVSELLVKALPILLCADDGSIGLFDPVSVLKLRYVISSHWTLQAERGEALGADVFYKIERGSAESRPARVPTAEATR